MTKPPPPSKEEYVELAVGIAMDFAPRIYPCKKCGWPVADGYCCRTCGDSNPSYPEEQQS